MAQIIFVNCAVSLLLTGVIWTIQLVHYPNFLFISKQMFPHFMTFHMRSITYIVGPLMSIELAVSAYLAIYDMSLLTSINIIIVTLIWLSTILLSIPCHNKLIKGYDEKTIKRLVLTNWPRTFLWSFKAVFSILILTQ